MSEIAIDYNENSKIFLLREKLKKIGYNPIIINNRIYYKLFKEPHIFMDIEVSQPNKSGLGLTFLFDGCKINTVFFANYKINEYFHIRKASDIMFSIVVFREEGICSIEDCDITLNNISKLTRDHYEVVAGPTRKILIEHFKEKENE